MNEKELTDEHRLCPQCKGVGCFSDAFAGYCCGACLEASKDDPMTRQEGGDHYRKLAIQPIEYIHKNKLPFIEGCIVKLVTRHRDKGKAEDVRKALHFCELLLKLEYGK